MSRLRKPQRRTFRYWLQQLHLWIGLILLLPLVMMGITGAVLVYAHDIEHLLGQGEPPAQDGRRLALAGRADRSGAAATSDPAAFRLPCAGRSRSGEPAAVRLSRPGMASERPQLPRRPARRQGARRHKAACRRKARSRAACRS